MSCSTYKCYDSADGKRPEVMTPICVDTPFTLQAINWTALPGKATFLKANGYDLNTVNDVTVDGTQLDSHFQFVFKKEGCADNSPTINYGDHLQLYCPATGKYIQCGGGRCGGVDKSLQCSKDAWQTFRVTADTGMKTGPLCFGQQIRISQVVVGNADITPADGGAVWATIHDSNDNAVLMILPVTGSVFTNPSSGGSGGSGKNCSSYSCFSDLNGVYGTMRREVLHPICVNTPFTLWARNWISSDMGNFSFLQSVGGNLETFDRVTLSKEVLESSFQFVFKKEGCVDSSATINYGDKVQLYCPATNKYMQCGAGTCSGVDDSGNCSDTKWQTFTVTGDVTGDKTGPVCFGDNIRISQVLIGGDNADITAAGGGGVWATKHNTNNNAILSIQPITGSVYEDPTNFVNEYVKTQKDDLCKSNPFAGPCVSSGLSNFFAGIAKFFTSTEGIFTIVGVVVAIIVIVIIIYYVRSSFSNSAK